MRAKLLIVGVLVLLMGGLAWYLFAYSPSGGGGKGSHAPPPIDHQLLVGKWNSDSDHLLITGFDFAGDGTLKMTIRGMKKPVPGRYKWSAEHTLALEYQLADVKQAYQEAVKTYREAVSKITDARMVMSLLAIVRDELPAEEQYQVGLSERPRLLILNNGQGPPLNFVPAD
jgi:hypothetical protein